MSLDMLSIIFSSKMLKDGPIANGIICQLTIRRHRDIICGDKVVQYEMESKLSIKFYWDENYVTLK